MKGAADEQAHRKQRRTCIGEATWSLSTEIIRVSQKEYMAGLDWHSQISELWRRHQHHLDNLG